MIRTALSISDIADAFGDDVDLDDVVIGIEMTPNGDAAIDGQSDALAEYNFDLAIEATYDGTST